VLPEAVDLLGQLDDLSFEACLHAGTSSVCRRLSVGPHPAIHR
jgi:hypothetical protein